jgi:hypothetical protein
MRALRSLPLLLVVSVAGCGGNRERLRVSVPAVVGVDLAAAECALAHARLHWRYAPEITRHAPQSEAAACGGRYPIGDNVCGQRPRPRAVVAQGTVVTLGTLSTASRSQRRQCRPTEDQPDDARAAILDVAFEYFRTAKVRAGSRTCKLLTEPERKRLDRRPGGCAVAVNMQLGHRLLVGQETVAVVLSLRGTAAVASASVLPISVRGRPPIIELRHQHGSWQVAATGL